MPPYDFSEMYGSQEGFNPNLQIPFSDDGFSIPGAGGGHLNPATGEWRGGPSDTRNQRGGYTGGGQFGDGPPTSNWDRPFAPPPQQGGWFRDGGWGRGNPPQGRGNDFWNSQGGTDYRQREQEQRQQELASMQQDQPQLPPAGGGEDNRQQERELLQQQEQQFPQGRPPSDGGPPWWERGPVYHPPGSQLEFQGQPIGPVFGGNRGGGQGSIGSPWGGGGYDPQQFGPGNYSTMQPDRAYAGYAGNPTGAPGQGAVFGQERPPDRAFGMPGPGGPPPTYTGGYNPNRGGVIGGAMRTMGGMFGGKKPPQGYGGTFAQMSPVGRFMGMEKQKLGLTPPQGAPPGMPPPQGPPQA